LMKLAYRKAESLTCLLIVFASVFAGLSLLSEVKATTPVISLTPLSGNVGSNVQLVGNITTANGTFQVLWDSNLLLLNASAVGNNVNVSLTIPTATSGNHNITLTDFAIGENANATFSVLTAYSLGASQKPAPLQWQESDDFQVFLNMTGGAQGQTNAANITVTAPNNASYWSLGNINTGSDGNGTLAVTYPTDFSSGANTNFTGQYALTFNSTLAVGSSFVGLTNSSTYHRDQTIDVKAVYSPGQSVTLSIIGTNINFSANITADNTTGIVEYQSSTILLNASASSTYTVNVTALSGSQKNPLDVQSFTVPGFTVNVTTRNRAREPVPNIPVTVYENQTGKLYYISNPTSDANGSTTLNLEVGDYFCNASFSGQEIGNVNIIVNETSTTFDLACDLTNLRIMVMDEDGVLIPDVEFQLARTLPPAQLNQTSAVSVDPTDVNGTSVAHSLLPIFNNASVDYALNASRYGMLFYTKTDLQLPVADWLNLTIVCPKENLYLNVTGASGQPIGNAIVDAVEEKGGLLYSNNTSADGTATLRGTFGRYFLQVYADGMKLNETTVDLNATAVNATIKCVLYGLNISVRVSDYFGQPIPNLGVTLKWIGYANSSSGVSGSDGIATFPNIVGGNLTLTTRFAGQISPVAVTTVYVDNSTTVEIRLDKYFIVAGMLVDLGQFVTVMIVVVFAVLILCFEVYRRRRRRPQQNGS